MAFNLQLYCLRTVDIVPLPFEIANHYSLGYFGIQPQLGNAFSSVNVTNQIFIVKHRPLAQGWSSYVYMYHNFCNSHGLVLRFMSTYEF